jgi:multicomponent K+:H+ antiporter subunit D
VVASMGTLLIAVGLNSASGLAAALYYAAQSTFTSAGLFLLAGLVIDRDGGGSTTAQAAAPNAGQPSGMMMVLAGLFFLLAIAMVGMPPLAGFVGKLLILDAGRSGGQMAIVWPAILSTSLMLILGFARAGIQMFWAAPDRRVDDTRPAMRVLPIAAISVMIAAMAALTVFAGPVMTDMNAAANQLLAPQGYIDAVLKSAPRAAAMVAP